MSAATMIWPGSATFAQSSSSTVILQTETAGASSPELPYGVVQIVKLAQAKVSDGTIIAYIKNAGDSYGLNADQIIYLSQQGVSDAVIKTMLSQPKPAVVAATPATPALQPATSTALVAPTVTYIQPAPPTTYYYYQPYYYPYCYYPYVSLYWYSGARYSYGSGWHGGGYYNGWHGGGYHGGYQNGWHGGGYGGGWHGGGHH